MKKFFSNLLLAIAAISFASIFTSCNNEVETETEYVYSYTDTVYDSLSSNYYQTYSFYGYAGTEYTVSWSDNSSYDIYVSAGNSTSDYTSYFASTSYSSKSFTPSTTGYVYIKARNTGSYSKSYSLTVGNNKNKVSLSKESSGYDYTYNYNDSVSGTISSGSDYLIYRFYAYSSSSYKVEWTNGTGAEMEVCAGSSLTYLYSYFDSTTTSGQTFSPSSSGYVYIKVQPYTSSYTGSFTLTVKSTSSSLSLSKYSDSSSLTYNYNDSASGAISSSSGYITYSFYAYSSSSYKVEWTNGSGARMKVSAGTSSSSPSTYFYETTTSGQVFTPSSSGTVYIKVQPYSSSYTGSFTLTLKSTSSSVSLSEYASSYAIDTENIETVYAYSTSSTDFSDFTKVYLASTSEKFYELATVAGRTYTVKWCDSNTSSSFTNTSSYTLKDGVITVYDSSYIQLNTSDTNASFTFTATGSTTYIGVKKYSSSSTNGYCGFYVYYEL